MRQLDVGQRPFVGRAHVGVDHLFAGRLVDRQRSGDLEVADHLRGAGPLAEQLNELAVQLIDSISQFFQRHFILVVRLRPGRGDSIKTELAFSRWPSLSLSLPIERVAQWQRKTES